MDDDEPNRHRTLDDELTQGYARALALEADRLGILRSIAAAAKSSGRNSREVKQLAFRLSALDAEIADLRASLETRRQSIDPTGRLY